MKSRHHKLSLLTSILIFTVAGTSQIVVADSICNKEDLVTSQEINQAQLAQSSQKSGYECTLRVLRGKPMGGGDPETVARVCARGASSDFSQQDLLNETNRLCQQRAKSMYQGVGENRYYCEPIYTPYNQPQFCRPLNNVNSSSSCPLLSP